MSDKKYTLDFHEALDIILGGGAVKGINFVPGYFLRLDTNGRLVLVDVNRFYEESNFVSIKSLSNQKFRSLSVMTKKELQD